MRFAKLEISSRGVTSVVRTDLLKTVLLVGLIVFDELTSPVVVYAVCLPIFILLFFSSWFCSDKLILYCWPLIFIFLLGGLVSLAEGSFDSDTLKGAYYSSRPLVFTGIGIYLHRSTSLHFQLFRKAIVIAALFLSLIYIYNYALYGEGISGDRYVIRDAVGAGYITVGIGAALMITELSSLRSRIAELCILPVLILALYLSDSRSALITIGLMVFCYYTNALLAPFAALSLMAILFVATTPLIQLFVDANVLRQSFATLPSGLVELISIQRYTDAEVNTGWRGYETFLAFSHVWSEGPFTQLLGTGWHGTVPLPWHIKLGAGFLPEIPVFHSAWSFIFVRSGYVGLILIFIQVAMWVSLFRSELSSRSEQGAQDVRKFALGLLLVSLVSIPTIAGVYNTGGTGGIFCICLGYFIGYACRRGPISVTKVLNHPLKSSAFSDRRIGFP
jgi:hypothetical protein